MTCTVNNRCSLGNKIEGVKSCEGCKDQVKVSGKL